MLFYHSGIQSQREVNWLKTSVARHWLIDWHDFLKVKDYIPPDVNLTNGEFEGVISPTP